MHWILNCLWFKISKPMFTYLDFGPVSPELIIYAASLKVVIAPLLREVRCDSTFNETCIRWETEGLLCDSGLNRVNPFFFRMCACSELRKQWKSTGNVCCHLAFWSLPFIQTCLHVLRIKVNFGVNKEKMTEARFEPATIGLTCRRSTNWAIQPYVDGLPNLSISLFFVLK